jgi:cell division protein FtsB
MIDSSLSTTATNTAGSALRERQLRGENSALVQQNAQLQGENRDLRAEQRRLVSENAGLQQTVGDLQRELTRSERAADPDSTSGTLLDVYA